MIAAMFVRIKFNCDTSSLWINTNIIASESILWPSEEKTTASLALKHACEDKQNGIILSLVVSRIGVTSCVLQEYV